MEIDMENYMTETTTKNLHWISILMRVSIGTLFFIAALGPLSMGIPETVASFETMFKNSIAPVFIVKWFGAGHAFVELAIVFWLFSGYKLRAAWLAAGFLLIILASGMLMIQKWDAAADDFMYVVMAGIGLLTSRFDKWQFARD